MPPTTTTTTTSIAKNALPQQQQNEQQEPQQKPLKEAPPPWHSVAILVAFLAFCVATLPSTSSIDESAQLSTFTARVFPQYISLKQLAYIRLFVAATIWWTTFHTAFIGKGWTQTIGYLPQSKLIRTPIRMYGINTMFPMTSWTWNLLGLSYSVNAYISLWAAYHADTEGNFATLSSKSSLLLSSTSPISPWLLRTALLLFEIAAPTTCLVAFVVRYAIWPRLLQVTGDSSPLRHPRNVMMHNVNAVYSLVEALLLGGIPVRRLDFAVAPLFGITYVVFLWSMTHRWGVDVSRHGPQVIYFFLDPTLGWFTTKALAVLMVVLMVFYALFASIHTLLDVLGWDGNIFAHVAAVVLISSVICRVRD